MLALIFAFGMTAQAATHSVYENGNLSSTYTTYFKDILSGVAFKDNYVAFRSGQYEYTMITGDIDYNESSKTFTLNGEGRSYVFSTNSSNYNSNYYYDSSIINNFSLVNDRDIIYSDLSYFPELIERGAKYEMLSAVLVAILLLGFVVRSFFRYR